MTTKGAYIQKVLINRPIWLMAFFVIFYAVGIAGMLIPYTYPLFIKLTPMALILSFLAIILVHGKSWTKKDILFFLGVYLISFFVEGLGVMTGVIFGSYSYGNGLGIKIWNTPLLIGINWVFMVFASAAILDFVRGSMAVKILGGAALMVLFDLVLEQVAPLIDMWSWMNNVVPLQNYLAWFALAIIFHTVYRILKLKSNSKIAVFLFILQMLFFIVLILNLRS